MEVTEDFLSELSKFTMKHTHFLGSRNLIHGRSSFEIRIEPFSLQMIFPNEILSRLFPYIRDFGVNEGVTQPDHASEI